MKKNIVAVFLLFLSATAAFADGYNYDVISQVSAQFYVWATGILATIIAIIGLIWAAVRMKLSGNYLILVTAIVAILFIVGATNVVDAQKMFASALFKKEVDQNGTFK